MPYRLQRMFCFALLVCCGMQAQAAESRVGFAEHEKLQQLLKVEMVLSAGQTTLEEWIVQLEGVVGLPVLKDRDLDEDQLIKLPAGKITLKGVLEQIALQTDSSVLFFAQMAYIGPTERVHPLKTLIALREQQLKSLPKAVRNRWLTPTDFQWQERVTTAQLLQEMQAQGRVEIENPEAIEHDVWRGNQLAQITRIELWSLVLIQFDAHFEFDSTGEQIRLVTVDALQPIELTQKRRLVRGVTSETLAELQKQYAGCQFEVQGRSLLLTGTAEWLDAVSRLLDAAN